MEFKDRLSKLIAESGKTQRKAAHDIGITPAAMCRYMNGSRLPTMRTLVLIKRSFGCTWEDLMGE